MIFTINVELTCDFCRKSKAHTDASFYAKYDNDIVFRDCLLPAGWTEAPHAYNVYRCEKCTAEKKGEVSQ